MKTTLLTLFLSATAALAAPLQGASDDDHHHYHKEKGPAAAIPEPIPSPTGAIPPPWPLSTGGTWGLKQRLHPAGLNQSSMFPLRNQTNVRAPLPSGWAMLPKGKTAAAAAPKPVQAVEDVE